MVKPALLLAIGLLLGGAATQSSAATDIELPLPSVQYSMASKANIQLNKYDGEANVHLHTSGTNDNPSWAKFASGTGSALFLVAGTLLPLVEDGKNGKEHTLRTADSLLTSAIITEALKTIIHEKRPDGSDYKSFPSGHATAAFALATMQAHYHPKQALFWYGGATIISASRVKLNRHFNQDVIVGAAVGFLTSELELKQRRGLLLFPFISGSKRARVSGLAFSGAF